MAIKEFRGKYFFLSNYYKAPVMFEGLMYTNNEAAFQSAKLLSIGERKIFCNLEPNEARKLGRKVQLRSDWESIKDNVMYQIVKDKFTRNPELKKKLLETGNEELIEGNWWGDVYWGVDIKTGKGQNKLGKILMKVREELKEKKQ